METWEDLFNLRWPDMRSLCGGIRMSCLGEGKYMQK